MELNANFNERVLIHAEQLEWKDSPVPGVRRRMLDRIGDEIARATTIVRFDPESRFSPHVHGGGEEFLVLDGVFEDEHGSFPRGSYVRNPPTSKHTPGSTPGCVMFVKLWQFDADDRIHIIQNIDRVAATDDLHRPGVSVIPLFRDERENVRIEMLAPNVNATIDTAGGAEILVLDGQGTQDADTLVRHTWLRVPDGAQTVLCTTDQPLRVWIKSGHLKYAQAPKA